MVISAKEANVPSAKETFKVLRNSALTTRWEPTGPEAELQEKVSP